MKNQSNTADTDAVASVRALQNLWEILEGTISRVAELESRLADAERKLDRRKTQGD